MAEKFTPSNEQADPAKEAARNDAWGVDPNIFADGNDYINNRPDVESSPDVDDVIFESNQEDGDVFSGKSLHEIAMLAREAVAADDKSTSEEAKAVLFDRMMELVDAGKIDEDTAQSRLLYLESVVYSEAEDDKTASEQSIESAHAEALAENEARSAAANKKEHKGIYSGRSVEELEEVIRNADEHGDNSVASEAQRELNIIKLRQRVDETWGKKPEATPSAAVAETTKRNSAPSEKDKEAAAEAARQASEASPDAPSEADRTAAAEAARQASEADTDGAEKPDKASVEKKEAAERRKSKIRKALGVAWGWLRNNERDDTSGGGSGKTTPRKRGAMAGAGSGVERARAEAGKSAEKEPAVAESDATKPSESDKTAAAEAVKSAEDTAAELIPASAEKSADTETTPADGAGPVEGEPAFDAEERKKAMIKSAEKSLRERFGVLRDVQNKSRNEQRTNGSVSTETQTALTAANGEYQTAQFTLNELRKGLDPAPSNETRD